MTREMLAIYWCGVLPSEIVRDHSEGLFCSTTIHLSRLGTGLQPNKHNEAWTSVNCVTIVCMGIVSVEHFRLIPLVDCCFLF